MGSSTPPLFPQASLFLPEVAQELPRNLRSDSDFGKVAYDGRGISRRSWLVFKHGVFDSAVGLCNRYRFVVKLL